MVVPDLMEADQRQEAADLNQIIAALLCRDVGLIGPCGNIAGQQETGPEDQHQGGKAADQDTKNAQHNHLKHTMPP